MNPLLSKIIVCPKCKKEINYNEKINIQDCDSCGKNYEILDHILCFANLSDKTIISSKPKPPGKGSNWRKENWLFNSNFADGLSPDDIILEIGCGRGYFKSIFKKNYIGLDVNAYKEADIICDLTKENCIREKSLDVVLLNNVLEHVYDYTSLIKAASLSLKIGGKMLITVPFSSIMHQVPHDYFRLTQFALKTLLEENDMKITIFEAVYSPIIEIRRSLNRLIQSFDSNPRNALATIFIKFLLIQLKIATKISNGIYPNGIVSILDNEIKESDHNYKSPIGYQLVAQKT
tara:strand:- start:2236 stop:3105 length:870 start_codon:yes stop_codon:yes gene_type:complete